MQNFHKELEALKNSGYSTGELRRDIEEMEKVFLNRDKIAILTILFINVIRGNNSSDF